MLVGCGTIVAGFALFEARTGINVFSHLSRVVPILHDHAEDGYLVPRGGRLRALASAQHPIALGAMLVLLLPFVTYLASRGNRRLWYACGAILALGAIATVSRTAIMMLVVEAIVFLRLRPVETRRLWPLLLPLLVARPPCRAGCRGSPEERVPAQGRHRGGAAGRGQHARQRPPRGPLAVARAGVERDRARAGRGHARGRGGPNPERADPRRSVARAAARHRRRRRRDVLLADPAGAPAHRRDRARGSLAQGAAADGSRRPRWRRSGSGCSRSMRSRSSRSRSCSSSCSP